MSSELDSCPFRLLRFEFAFLHSPPDDADQTSPRMFARVALDAKFDRMTLPTLFTQPRYLAQLARLCHSEQLTATDTPPRCTSRIGDYREFQENRRMGDITGVEPYTEMGLLELD